MKYAVQANRLVKEFGGVRAVDDLSIAIPKGQITGLIGPNGSGKTTLTNLLTGFSEIGGGSITLNGEHEHSHIRPHHVRDLGITRTFQGVRLFEQISVLDNILVVLTKRNVWRALFERPQAHYHDQAKIILERVDLWSHRTANASELSYGQRKLLEIARVLATRADIILFDEPYAGLFPEMVKQVSEIMRDLRTEDKTIVLIEHDMALIRQLCDHVLVMDAGKLLTQGTPGEVLTNQTVIEAYLGA